MGDLNLWDIFRFIFRQLGASKQETCRKSTLFDRVEFTHAFFKLSGNARRIFTKTISVKYWVISLKF